MDKVFIDTWGWLTLRDKKEAKHSEVSRIYHNFRSKNALICTTDYIFDVTITMFYRRFPLNQAKDSGFAV